MIVLFFSRLLLYLLAMALPFIHPAIVVPYDTISALIWFVLVPGEMAIGYFLAPPRFRARTWIASAIGLLALTELIVPGWDSFLLILAAGSAAFLLTVLIFHIGARTRAVFVLEQFFLALVYYRMLTFSQASEDVAQASTGITQLILALTIVAFLIHGAVLYITSMRAARLDAATATPVTAGANGAVDAGKRRRSARAKKEIIGYAALAVTFLLIVAIVLPPNFVKHSIVTNLLNGQVHPKPIPFDQSGRGVPDNGNLQNDQYDPFGQNGRQFGRRPGNGQQGQQNGQNGDQGSLQGVPADQWQNPTQGNNQGQGKGQGQQGQRAVMVVASTHSPVYAADGYYDHFDPVEGFVKSQNDPLNDLVRTHLIGTWTNPQQNTDIGRQSWEVHFFSTIPDRVLQYLPESVEPTVQKNQYYPFSYFYDSTSLVSIPDRKAWDTVPDLTSEQKAQLAPYLQVDMPQKYSADFTSFLDKQERGSQSYIDRIIAILKGFSTYQYQLGFTDSVTTAHMDDFLTNTKEGDCTEFSNTAAILGRLEGIPSRVVTGYLASKTLQTSAHKRGLYILQQSIPELQNYPLDDLFLVTTSHRHSWVQYYLPEYGWVDFESTAFALPPPPGQGPNDMQVVIPLIQPKQEPAPAFQFPWLLMLEILLTAAVAITVLLYLYRYGKEATLLFIARRRGHRGAWALYRVMLMKLAAAGYHLKPPAKTPREYAAVHPEVEEFSMAYTRLAFRDQSGEPERRQLWERLTRDYRTVINGSRKPGLAARVRRFFSLRGLYY